MVIIEEYPTWNHCIRFFFTDARLKGAYSRLMLREHVGAKDNKPSISEVIKIKNNSNIYRINGVKFKVPGYYVFDKGFVVEATRKFDSKDQSNRYSGLDARLEWPITPF